MTNPTSNPVDLSKLTIDEVGELRRCCVKHLSTWFGFSKDYKARQTPEFIESVKWRLEGQMEPCCECGVEYPRLELHFYGEIYCPKCREAEGATT